jgi:hypothetical protein
MLETILAPLAPHEAAAAYRSGRSIRDNAGLHAGRAIVARLDLEEFFPSISFRRVKGLLTAVGYNEGVATLLALLATEPPRITVTLNGERRHVALGERRLPQGACTSPAISNLLCRRLDARLTGLAGVHEFRYSRYADDLLFSTDRADAPLGAFLHDARRIIAAEGFRVNEGKTAVMRRQHRQVATGLVVNEAPHVSREDLRRFRAFLHHCETDGLPAMSERLGRNAAAYAAGYLAFLHMISPDHAARLREQHPWIAGGAPPAG